MDLGNILKRDGGTPVTGRQVKFHLVAKDKGGTLQEFQVEAVLMPVTEDGRLDAMQEARDYCAQQKRPDDFPIENDLRVLCKALRDPEDVRKQFCLTGDLHLLRSGLVHCSLSWLAAEYEKLLKEQYPETVSQAEFDKMKAEARGFTEGGQQESGPSSP